jgi:hypothetical protein
MSQLNETARAVLRRAGVTPAEWDRANWGNGTTWTGDSCGCPDNRCANGFHHMGADDCGCLPTLLDLYLRDDGGAFAIRRADQRPVCTADVEGDVEDGDGRRYAEPCGAPSRFIVERSDLDPSWGAEAGAEEACAGHLAGMVLGMISGDTNVSAIVTVRWDGPGESTATGSRAAMGEAPADDLRARIREHLTTYPGLTECSIARALGVAKSSVKYRLKAMREDGEAVPETTPKTATTKGPVTTWTVT